ncbi:serine/threonine-protein kinase [Kitasatospora cineracea]|uniref:serine/threonine-protein kinase n=1 Tax=Kitasatospora cineracea TaxID=88074 RepID=UPI00378FF9E1
MNELQSSDPRQVGRYRIIKLLGSGGMGRVYLGQSPSGRLVAVKIVRAELAEDQGFRRRFAREVAAARKVTGFFTAAVVDADTDSTMPWLATAYIPGLPLDQAVATFGPWPVESVRALGAGLAEALEAIHAAGLIHRDLKPSNVLIAQDGPRVVDFGISVAAEATALTRTGMVIGTPGFMAPEQLTGGRVTPATDVFALGAVLAYAATTVGPFGTGSAQALNFRIAYEEPDLSRLPPQGLEIIARCLAKNPDQRPSASLVLEELAPAHSEQRRPVEMATRTTAWMPPPVARALQSAEHAVAVPADRPEPLPDPPSDQAVAPTPSAPSPVFGRPVLPFWTAITALVLGTVLPSNPRGMTMLGSIADDTLPFVVVAALGVASCIGALFLSRAARTSPIPRWPRYVHVLVAVLNLLLAAKVVALTRVDLHFYRVGSYAYFLGAMMLVYGSFRFPSPNPKARTRRSRPQ